MMQPNVKVTQSGVLPNMKGLIGKSIFLEEENQGYESRL